MGFNSAFKGLKTSRVVSVDSRRLLSYLSEVFFRPIQLDIGRERFIVHRALFFIPNCLSTSYYEYQLFIGCEKTGNEQNSKKRNYKKGKKKEIKRNQ